MNYQHEFHAGNFADVFKHAVFCRILQYLLGKPAAFRVIDTHAGAGLYDLANEKAMRGAEWQSGIGKLMDVQISQTIATLLSPYLDVVRAVNERGQLRTYPGSPALARAWLRPQDRLLACELVPAVAAKTLPVDGWVALNAYVPRKSGVGWCLSTRPSKLMTISND
jgi:23S rRNA (adenine2030-N6)-methyltransferase